MPGTKEYRKALAGLRRCNRTAYWTDCRGFVACREHGDNLPDLLMVSEQGPPESYGRCDVPLDGMGAASWPKRLAAQGGR